MESRSRSRLVAAAAAAGTVVVSLASGGAASADDVAAPDTTPPALIAELPTPSPRGWFTDPVSISLVAADLEGTVASIHWSVDGGPESTAFAASATATIATGGEHVFEAYALDAAGNRSAVVTRDVNVDLAAPWVATFSQPQDAVFDVDEEVLLGYICADDLSGVEECVDTGRIDGRLDTSTVGPHELIVVARDVAGHQSITPYRYTVVSDDTTPPTVRASVSGTHVNDEWFTSDDVRVTLAVDDPTEQGVSIEYAVPGRWPTSVGGTSTTFDLPGDGVFDIVFRAQDRLHNLSEPQTITVRRDAVAPTIAVSAHEAPPVLAPANVPNGAVVPRGAEIAFAYDCTDATSGVVACEGDVPSGALLSTEDLGYHSVLVTSTDAAGNESSSIFEYTVEDEREPTDPGSGGDPNGPAQPGGSGGPGGGGGPAGPVQPGTSGSASGQASAPRAAATDDDGWLAETGGVPSMWGLGFAVALLLGGAGAIGAGAMRRRRERAGD